MRPKTSVRPPIIAAAQRRHLSELLRRWRRQPRQRSRTLFAIVLTLALMSDTAILFLGIHLFNSHPATVAPPNERRMHVPFAANAELWEPLRYCPLRTEGQTHLFETFCRAAVRDITGDECFEERDPVAVVASWMLDGDADSLGWSHYPFVRCEDAELRAVLYGEEENPSCMTRAEQLHGRYIEPAAAQSCRALHEILAQAASNDHLSQLERQALELQQRLMRWHRLRTGAIEGDAEMATVSAELRQAYQAGDKELFATACNDILDVSRRVLGVADDRAAQRRLAAENWLNQRTPARKACQWSLLTVLSLAVAALVKIRRPKWHRAFLGGGVLAAFACLAWSTAAIVACAFRAQVLLGEDEQRMLFLSSATLGLGFLTAFWYREKLLARCAAVLASIGFFLSIRGLFWPCESENDFCFSLCQLLLLSAFAALALAWSISLVVAGRVLFLAPNGERLRKLAALCLATLRLGIVLWVGSALVDALRTVGADDSWHGGNLRKAFAPFLGLTVFFAFLYAHRRGWMQPFALAALGGIAFPLAILIGYAAHRTGTELPFRTVDAWLCAMGLLHFSLVVHAALRYYFGRQRVFDA